MEEEEARDGDEKKLIAVEEVIVLDEGTSGRGRIISRETPEVTSCILLNRCKLQSTGSNVTKMATKVKLASQHVVVAHDDWFIPLCRC